MHRRLATKEKEEECLPTHYSLLLYPLLAGTEAQGRNDNMKLLVWALLDAG
jgi:hypothetical protein